MYLFASVVIEVAWATPFAEVDAMDLNSLPLDGNLAAHKHIASARNAGRRIVAPGTGTGGFLISLESAGRARKAALADITTDVSRDFPDNHLSTSARLEKSTIFATDADLKHRYSIDTIQAC